MQRLGPFLLSTAILCLLLGSGFGIFWYKKDLAPFLIRYPTHLQVLGSQFDIPSTVTEDFEKVHAIRLRWTKASDEFDLAQQIERDSQKYDLIFAPSFILQPMISPDRFKKLGHYLKPLLSEVSPDFLQLEFDTPNDYSLPMFWGYRGFIQTGTPKTVSLREALTTGKPGTFKVILLPSALEVYRLLEILGLNPNGKIKQDQWEELEKDLLRLKPFVAFREPEPVKSAQKPQGYFELRQVEAFEAGSFEKEEVELKHPLEKSTLWIEYAVVPMATRKSQAVGKFLNFITQPKTLATILESQHRASAWSMDAAEIPAKLRSSYLREISIQNLELFVDQSITSEKFLRLIEKVWNRKLTVADP